MAALDIGIDLGTSNMMAGSRKKGITVSEASVVAINKNSNKIIGVGNDVYRMIGREHSSIKIIHPLENGVISNYDMTSVLARFLLKGAGKSWLVKPRVIACVPCAITTIEAKSLIETIRSAGARSVYLMHEPLAAALGIGIDIALPIGNMIVDIGGGTCDVAVLSLGEIVSRSSSISAGNAFDRAIEKHVDRNSDIIIGSQTAETIKKEIANLYRPDDKLTIEIKGYGKLSERPEKTLLSSVDLFPALKSTADGIVACIQKALESTPPELNSDIAKNGIYLTGGGSLIRGLDSLLERAIGVPVQYAKAPMTAPLEGVLKGFNYIDNSIESFYDPYQLPYPSHYNRRINGKPF